MGQNVMKPKKLPIQINHARSNTNGNTNPSNPDINKTDDLWENQNDKKIIKIVKETYNLFIRDRLKDENADGNLQARGVNNKRPLSEDNSNKNNGRKYQKMELLSNDCKLFSDVYSMNDLIEFFEQCEKFYKSPDSQKSEQKGLYSQAIFPLEKVNTDPPVKFHNLSEDELRSLLLKKKIHLALAADPGSIQELTFFMDIASTFHILEEVIDLTDSKGNSAISVALLHSNMEAFRLLLNRQPTFPMYIFIKEREVTFLNYVALNGRICKNPKAVEYLLEPVLKIVVRYYPKKKLKDDCEAITIKKFLCEIDKETGLSLPHLLLTIYQNSADLRAKITACLKLCLEACPKAFEVHCISYYCPMYKFDVIAHSIILPVTNYEIIELMLKANIPNNDRQLYKHLVEVHSDPLKRDRLTKLIDDTNI